MKTDRVKTKKQEFRQHTIKLVRDLAELVLEGYKEPSRAGTPKGDPIGFSRKKYEAALMMALYPNCLKLKEIADIVGVSEGVLRVWRTEQRFQKLMEKEHRLLGEKIANTIELEVRKECGLQPEEPLEEMENKTVIKVLTVPDDPWYADSLMTAILPFLNSVTVETVFESLKKNLGDRSALIQLPIIMAYTVQNERDMRNWFRNPSRLALMKELIAYYIEQLIDPKTSEKEKIAENLKKIIFTNLDGLAS